MAQQCQTWKLLYHVEITKPLNLRQKVSPGLLFDFRVVPDPILCNFLAFFPSISNVADGDSSLFFPKPDIQRKKSISKQGLPLYGYISISALSSWLWNQLVREKYPDRLSRWHNKRKATDLFRNTKESINSKFMVVDTYDHGTWWWWYYSCKVQFLCILFMNFIITNQ